MPGKTSLNELLKYFTYDNKTFKFGNTNDIKYNFSDLNINNKIQFYDNNNLQNYNNRLYLTNKNLDISSINTQFNFSILESSDEQSDYSTGFSKHGIHLNNKGVSNILSKFSNFNPNGLLTYDHQNADLLFYDNTSQPSLLSGNNFKIDMNGNIKLMEQYVLMTINHPLE